MNDGDFRDEAGVMDTITQRYSNVVEIGAQSAANYKFAEHSNMQRIRGRLAAEIEEDGYLRRSIRQV